MAKNELVFAVKVNSDGTLGIIAKDAKKLASSLQGASKATEQLTNSRNTFSKTEKGLAGITSNNTKAFSKQAQGLSKGLVPAYAALAANIFAITAAFGALKRASGLEQLEKGLIATGAASGRNLPQIANQLRDITGAAISSKQAMEAVALGVSAGFQSSQLKELTTVAKGASLALGRDMGDALDRLIRGATKLEPEILDELGIMVRLDDAVSDYAKTVNKSVSSLTDFERRMAFTNKVISQGKAKFDEIAEAVDPSPYNQLSASFSDLSQSLLGLINVGIGPLISFLGNNNVGLSGAALLFSSTITRQMIPGLYGAAEASETLANELKATNLDKLKELSLPNIGEDFEDMSKKIVKGTAELEDFQSVLSMLKEEGGLQEELIGLSTSYDKRKGHEQQADEIVKAQKKITESMVRSTVAAREESKSTALSAASQLKVGTALEFLNHSYKDIDKAQAASMIASGNVATTWSKLRVTGQKLSITLKTMGTAFLAVIPYIGLAITAAGLLYEAWKKLIPENAIKTAAKNSAKSLNDLQVSALTMEASLAKTRDPLDKIAKQLKFAAGFATTLAEGITVILDAADKLTTEKLNKMAEGLVRAQKALKRAKEGGGEFDVPLEVYERKVELFKQGLEGAANAVGSITSNSLTEITTAATTALALAEAQLNKDSNSEGYKSQVKEYEELLETLEKISKIQKDGLIVPETTDFLRKELLRIAAIPNTINDSVNSAKASFSSLTDVANTLTNKTKGPLDDMVDNLSIIENHIGNLSGANLDLFKRDVGNADLVSLLEKLGKGDFAAGVTIYKKEWESLNSEIVNSSANIKEQHAILNNLSKRKDSSESSTLAYLRQQNAVIEAQWVAKGRELEQAKKLKDFAKDKTEGSKELLALNNKINAIETERSAIWQGVIPEDEILNKGILTRLTLEAQTADIVKSNLDNNSKLIELELEKNSILKSNANIAKGGDGSLSAAQELALIEDIKAARVKSIEDIRNAELTAAELAYDTKVANMKDANTFDEAKNNLLKEQLSTTKAIINTTADNSVSKLALEIATKAKDVEKEKLDTIQQQLDATLALRKANLDLANIKVKKASAQIDITGVGVTPEQEYRLFNKTRNEKLELANTEFEIKMSIIAAEYDRMDAEWKLLVAKASAEDKSGYEQQRKDMEATKNAAIETVEAQKQIYALSLDTQGTKLLLNIYDKMGEAFSNIISTLGESNYGDIAASIFNIGVAFQKSAIVSEASANRIISIEQEMARIQEKITNAKEGADTNDLEKKYKDASDTRLEISKQEANSRLAMESMVLSGIGGMLNSLAAEQDTSSKKGFETAKKMQMAATVINTAAAVMNAMAQPMPWPASIAAAALAAATGAIQLAKIKSTSFGSASGTASGPSGNIESGSAPTTGTVLGDSTKQSESISKTDELLNAIHAKEYAELRSIDNSINLLSKNLLGLVGNILREVGDFSEASVEGNFGVNVGTTASKYDISKSMTTTVMLDPSASLSKLLGGNNILTKVLGGPSSLITTVANYISNALFGGKVKTSIKDSGIKLGEIAIADVTAGLDAAVEQYAYVKVKKSGGLLGKSKTKYKDLTEAVDSDVERLFNQILDGLSINILGLTEGLGGLTEDAMNYVFDFGKISLYGMDGAEMQEALAAVISTQADLAVEAILGDIVAPFQDVDEGLYETATRIFTAQEVFRETLNVTGNNISGSLLEISDSIVEAFGGSQEFQKAFDNFFETFYTEQEQAARRATNLTEVFKSAFQDTNLPSDRAGYTSLIQNADLNTESGRSQYIELLDLASVADEYYTYIESVLEKRFELEQELLLKNGHATEALALSRAKELEEIDSSLIPLQQRVWAMEDARDVMSLELELMKLTGRASEALIVSRQLEFQSLTDNLKPIQEEIWLLEDAAKTRDLELALMAAQGKSYDALIISRQKELEQLSETDKAIKLATYRASSESDYINTFGTSLQKLQYSLRDGGVNALNKALSDIGLTLPLTEESFNSYINTLKSSTNELGRIAYQTLLDAVPVAKEYYDLISGQDTTFIDAFGTSFEKLQNSIKGKEVTGLTSALSNINRTLPQTEEEFVSLFNSLRNDTSELGQIAKFAMVDAIPIAKEFANYLKEAKSYTIDSGIRGMQSTGLDAQASIIDKLVNSENELIEARDRGYDTTSLVATQQKELNNIIDDLVNTAYDELISATNALTDRLISEASEILAAAEDYAGYAKDLVSRQLSVDDNDSANTLFNMLVDQTTAIKSAIDKGYDVNKLAILQNREFTKAYEDIKSNAYEALLSAQEALASAELDAKNEGIQSALDIAENWKAVAENIKNTLESLLGGNLSTLSPEQKLAQSKGLFESNLAAARSGDVEAASGIGQYATEYATAAREYYASTSQYASIFDSITSGLEGLESIALDKASPIDRLTNLLSRTQKDSIEIAREALAAAQLDYDRALESDSIAKNLFNSYNSDALVAVSNAEATIARLEATRINTEDTVAQLQEAVRLASDNYTNTLTAKDDAFAYFNRYYNDSEVTAKFESSLSTATSNIEISMDSSAFSLSSIDSVTSSESDSNEEYRKRMYDFIDYYKNSDIVRLAKEDTSLNQANAIMWLISSNSNNIYSSINNGTSFITSAINSVRGTINTSNSILNGIYSELAGTSSYDVGSSYVAGDQLANIHNAEMVIDRKSADVLRTYGIKVENSNGGMSDEATESLKEQNKILLAQNALLQAGFNKMLEKLSESNEHLEDTANTTRLLQGVV